MTSLADKAQVAKRLEAAIKGANLSPHDLKTVFAEMGDSAEKLQSMLKLLFAPLHRPKFVKDGSGGDQTAGIHDVEFFGVPEKPPTQSPFRMFDIATGNLVEFPNLDGSLGQYAMLSHRWQGYEVTLADIQEARSWDMNRALSGSSSEDGVRGRRLNDVELTLHWCQQNLADQEAAIKDLVGSEVRDDSIVESLLEKRLRANALAWSLQAAKTRVDKALTQLNFAKVEGKIFETLLTKVKSDMDKGHDVEGQTESKSTSDNGSNAIHSLVESADDELCEASRKLRELQVEQENKKDDLNFFVENGRLREAVDTLISVLQKWQSAIKIQQSISRASTIFRENLFPHSETSYLWLDTCCIDKRNGSELAESIALMGDWYSEAAFALVFLGDHKDDHAISTWRRYKEKSEGKAATSSVVESYHFKDIISRKPQWSTRAWTLQELVLSRTTYYTGPDWSPLRRPIESLGHFYHLVPFMSMYCGPSSSHDAAGESWDLVKLHDLASSVASPYAGRTTFAGTEQADPIKTAHSLIIILDALGFQFPRDMTAETSRADMAQAVYLAAANLANEVSESRRNLFDNVKECLPEIHGSQEPIDGARQLINILLQRLVAETLGLIRADKQYLARFGFVEPLRSWQTGTRTSTGNFATQDVMKLLASRQSTKAIDNVYSVMGLLDVRFPAFHAEGVPRAMARLLDTVLIHHNDVSVFNWAGLGMTCPVRGRSMYPSSHLAYCIEDGTVQRTGDNRGNLLLAQAVQGKLQDVMGTYHGVIFLLQEATIILKDSKLEGQSMRFSVAWIRQIVEMVQTTSLPVIKPHLTNLAKLIGYIIHQSKKASETLAVVPNTGSNKTPDKTLIGSAVSMASSLRPTLPSLPSLPKVPTVPSMPSMPLMPSIPSVSSISSIKDKKLPKFGLSRKTTPTSPTIQQAPSQPEPPTTVPEPIVTSAPQVLSPVTIKPTSVPETQATVLAPEPNWEANNTPVQLYLDKIKQNDNSELPLPEEILGIDFPLPNAPSPPTTGRNPLARKGQPPDVTSPNPIIVTNAGIEGLFDIQRVIVTMVDHAKLRQQVGQAVASNNPNQIISGWCSISTGFARVIIQFASAAKVLEQQLDVVESVERRVLREQDRAEGQTRRDVLAKGLAITRVSDRLKQDDEKSSKPLEEAGDEGSTEEERAASRVIAFVQQTDLRLVAGEWVLARVSGVGGEDGSAAHWFLCHLELGSTTNQFYGRRVPTNTVIDFGKAATPETGLVRVWQAYMDRKARKMCAILNLYMDSRTSAAESADARKEGLKHAKKGAGLAGWEGAKSSSTGDDSDSDSEDPSDPTAWLSGAWRQSQQAAEALGKSAYLAAVETWLTLRGDRLEQNLSASVLKRTPKALQPAVENINDNRNLLPSMFHSAQQVHMF